MRKLAVCALILLAVVLLSGHGATFGSASNPRRPGASRLAMKGAVALLRADSVADEYDRYGRLLAHVFVGGRQLELIQLSRGWAEVYRYKDQRFDGLAAFVRSAAGARRADRGVWGVCGGDFHSSRLDG
jgi:hypothetical protein